MTYHESGLYSTQRAVYYVSRSGRVYLVDLAAQRRRERYIEVQSIPREALDEDTSPESRVDFADQIESIDMDESLEYLHDAIDRLADATREEQCALHEILRQDCEELCRGAHTPEAARSIMVDALGWFREAREECKKEES